MAARPWSIHMKTIDGKETTLQLHQNIYDRPVAELIKAACDELGMRTGNHLTGIVLCHAQ